MLSAVPSAPSTIGAQVTPASDVGQEREHHRRKQQCVDRGRPPAEYRAAWIGAADRVVGGVLLQVVTADLPLTLTATAGTPKRPRRCEAAVVCGGLKRPVTARRTRPCRASSRSGTRPCRPTGRKRPGRRRREVARTERHVLRDLP